MCEVRIAEGQRDAAVAAWVSSASAGLTWSLVRQFRSQTTFVAFRLVTPPGVCDKPRRGILQANGKPVSQPADVATAFVSAKQDGKPILLRIKSGDIVRFLALSAKNVG